MKPDPKSLSNSEARSATRTGALAALWHNMSVQDYAIIAYQSYLLLRAFSAPDSDDAQIARRVSLFLFTVALSTIAVVRGELLPKGKTRAIIYRVGGFGSMLSSYFLMRWLVPSLQQPLLDGELLAIDQAIFVVTPSVWLAQFNDLHTVEWFAFFYYSYFYMMGVLLIPTMFFDRGKRPIELLGGALTVCALGHIGYTLVPGYGPFAYLEFAEPVNGGFWWDSVIATVHSGGAMMDIFPSLHTAYPTFFTLYAFGNRKFPVYRYLWPVLAFFTANIIIATMFLRWHWGIDVIFGLLLAVTARLAGLWLASRDGRRGTTEDNRQPIWEPLFNYQKDR
ncbi:MAG: phosphatase PAP2 family protein [Myxococcota bacterium]